MVLVLGNPSSNAPPVQTQPAITVSPPLYMGLVGNPSQPPPPWYIQFLPELVLAGSAGFVLAIYFAVHFSPRIRNALMSVMRWLAGY